MPKLVDLPDDIWYSVCSNWIGAMFWLTRFDTACCDRVWREQLLSWVELSPHGFLSTLPYRASKSATLNYFNWLLIRKCPIQNLVFDRNIADCIEATYPDFNHPLLHINATKVSIIKAHCCLQEKHFVTIGMFFEKLLSVNNTFKPCNIAKLDWNIHGRVSARCGQVLLHYLVPLLTNLKYITDFNGGVTECIMNSKLFAHCPNLHTYR